MNGQNPECFVGAGCGHMHAGPKEGRSTLHRVLPLDDLLLALQGCSSIFTVSQLLLGEPAAAISFSEPCIAHGLGETATHAGICFCGGMIPSKRQILPGFGFF